MAVTKHKAVLIASVTVAALVVAVLVAVAVRGGNGGGSADPTVSAESSQPPVDEAAEVAAALEHLADDPESLISVHAEGFVRDRARQAVPAGSSVRVAKESWSPDGIGGGTIVVTIRAPRRPAVSYAAVVTLEDEEWKVLATMPLTARNAR